MDALHSGDEIGRLAFNFVTGAQDDEITRIDVSESDVSGAADRKIVIADFVSIRVPTRVAYYFERSEGRWYLDDVSSPGNIAAEMPAWTLSIVLKYGGRTWRSRRGKARIPVTMAVEGVRTHPSILGLTAGIAALLAIVACTGEAAIPDPAATGDTSSPGLLLEPNGIAPFDEGMEERHIGFGSASGDVLAGISEFIVGANRNGSLPECGAGQWRSLISARSP